MKKVLKVLCFLLCMTLPLVFSTGCTDSETKAYKATATLRIKELPESYYKLNENIQKRIEVSITLRPKNSKSTSDDVDFYLKASNGYSKKVYLKPGEYIIGNIYVFPEEMAPFSCDCEDEKSPVISVSRNENTDIELPINVQPVYEMKDEIKDASPFSHKIQIRDKVYNMEDLVNDFSFNMEKSYIIEVGSEEYKRFPSNILQGLYVLTDPDDETNQPVGVCFCRSDIRLWNGMSVGEKMFKLDLKKYGLENKLSFCKGSPILSCGFDNTKFDFLNDENNDILELNVNGNYGYVEDIKYLFKK